MTPKTLITVVKKTPFDDGEAQQLVNENDRFWKVFFYANYTSCEA